MATPQSSQASVVVVDAPDTSFKAQGHPQLVSSQQFAGVPLDGAVQPSPSGHVAPSGGHAAPQIIFVQAAGQPSRRRRRRLAGRAVQAAYRGRPSVAMGSSMLALAALSVGFSTWGLVAQSYGDYDDDYDNWTWVVGAGFWCPIWYISAGSLAVAAGRRKLLRNIRATLGLGVMSAVAACIHFSLSVVGVLADTDDEDDRNRPSLAMGILCTLISAAMIGLSIATSHIAGSIICHRIQKETDNQPRVIFTNSEDVSSRQHGAEPNIYSLQGAATAAAASSAPPPPPAYNLHQEPPSYQETLAADNEEEKF